MLCNCFLIRTDPTPCPVPLSHIADILVVIPCEEKQLQSLGSLAQVEPRIRLSMYPSPILCGCSEMFEAYGSPSAWLPRFCPFELGLLGVSDRCQASQLQDGAELFVRVTGTLPWWHKGPIWKASKRESRELTYNSWILNSSWPQQPSGRPLNLKCWVCFLIHNVDTILGAECWLCNSSATAGISASLSWNICSTHVEPPEVTYTWKEGATWLQHARGLNIMVTLACSTCTCSDKHELMTPKVL